MDSFFSYLCLHPNNLLTKVATTTYLLMLKHASNEFVSQATTSLMEKLKILKDLVLKDHSIGIQDTKVHNKKNHN